jgi:hypothetical protein
MGEVKGYAVTVRSTTRNKYNNMTIKITTPIVCAYYPSLIRRSFMCGSVLRYQFNCQYTQVINNNEVSPTFRGGINSVMVT